MPSFSRGWPFVKLLHRDARLFIRRCHTLSILHLPHHVDVGFEYELKPKKELELGYYYHVNVGFEYEDKEERKRTRRRPNYK